MPLMSHLIHLLSPLLNKNINLFKKMYWTKFLYYSVYVEKSNLEDNNIVTFNVLFMFCN